MTAVRRLAAILAADVVGYSRLMGEDEADTARAVRERREAAQPIVANLGGRIVKTTGDGWSLPPLSQRWNVRCDPEVDGRA
jgi:class 3 adenylate cyclase